MFGKVLLLEDDQGINTLIADELIKEGINVVRTFDGREAIEHIDHTIDLAILDVMVPKVDGIGVLAHIRKEYYFPVIFLTAKSTEVDKVLALGMGADDYMTKPFSIIELVYRVKAHLRRQLQYRKMSENQSNIITYGDIEMDLTSYMVRVGNEKLEFNMKEFDLLKFFVKNPGQVFTKKQLYEAVWDDSFYGDDNTVMVHISRIREKLKDNVRNPKYIKTIKGLGYRMEIIN